MIDFLTQTYSVPLWVLIIMVISIILGGGFVFIGDID